MSPQMHRPDADRMCPACAEPLEQEDRYCGACGQGVPAGSDRPTLAIGSPPFGQGPGVSVPPPGGGPDASQRRGGYPEPAYPEPSYPESPTPTPAPAAYPEPSAYQGPGAYPEPGARQEQGSPPYPYQEPSGQAPHPGSPAPQHGVMDPPGGGGTAPVAPGSGGDPRAPGGPAPAGAPGTVCAACRAGRVDRDGYCETCGHAQPDARDHQELELSSVAAVSDRGRRHHRNEDAFAVSVTALPDGSPATVAVVCDGVSSATRPDEASRAAARTADELLLAALPRGVHPQQAMRDAILAAGAAVNDLAKQPPSGGDPRTPEPHHRLNAPACTIAAAVSAGGLLIVGWIGDSRVYWVPDDRSRQASRLTEDDSWAAQMVAAGLMGEAEAYADERAHAITGWLGADAYELDPHVIAFAPDHPGVVVVCTDGLWNYAEAPTAMARTVPVDAAARPLPAARSLVVHALDGGGHDNITVAVLPFPVAPAGTRPSPDRHHRP
ncbi:protein phosphatase 2C domain-containing protein [Streptomyces sp. NPDC000594]|uniref:protein phosphatase 2C domain-containing protein n=1 Tax=Streptomyces sp. NPDC000594 TaxID=3154261 RepID=UPI00331A890A